MKNSSIAESVFRVNLKYVELQNKTKELFFRCLDENRDTKYFNEELKKIWGDLDHSFMKDEINEYETLIHERNIEGKEIIREEKQGNILDLVPLLVILGIEKKFVKQKEKEYKVSTKSYAYKNDKEDYLKQKVQRYTDQIVPYYSKSTGKKIRDVELSTYASMIHNTNLTRAGWNQTLKDADMLGQELFFIPYHSFSCPYCMQYQNKPLTRREAIDIAGHAEEAEGDLLHPNCKCELTFYENKKDFNKPRYSQGELEEQYHIRQKTNSLTLQKEKIKTDMTIQKRLGNQDEVDKLNQQRNKINKEIRELKEQLPTKELKKQVVAINR
jgi:hypothetical protein